MIPAGRRRSSRATNSTSAAKTGSSASIWRRDTNLRRASAPNKPFARLMRLDYRKHGMDKPTLAQKLGMTVHLSPLLHKARRLGLGQRELEVLVVQRGCRHYSDGSEPKEPVATEE